MLDDSKPSKDPRGEVANADEFLLDYLKHKRWIDTTTPALDIDTDDDDENMNSNKKNVEDDEYDSEEELEKMDAFESRYNFRFEEQQAQSQIFNNNSYDKNNDNENKHGEKDNEATNESHTSKPRIVSYARSSIHTIRKKDESRKTARQARKERKLAERKQKEEQLRRLKNAKREEMEHKTKMILKVAGTSGKTTKMEEDTLAKLLEGDYNENKFEELMQELYNDDYYEGNEMKEEDVEALRAEIMAEEGINEKGEGWFENDVAAENGIEGDEDEAYAPDGGDDYNEFEDFHENGEDEGEGESGYDGNKNEEPEMNPIQKQLQDKVQEELYKLDYEDMIGDMPCRFKYRQVEPNSYGLSTEEVLFAKDSTLKQYVSLKKLAPYNNEKNSNHIYQSGGGEYHVNAKKRKRFRDMLKKDWEELMEEEGMKGEQKYGDAMNVGPGGAGKKKDGEDVGKKKKRRRQKKKKDDGEGLQEETQKEIEKEEKKLDTNKDDSKKEEGKKKRRKKKGKKINKKLLQSQEGSELEEKKEEERNNVFEEIEDKTKNLKRLDNENEGATPSSMEKRLRKKLKKKNKKMSKLESKTGVPASRLASYGL